MDIDKLKKAHELANLYAKAKGMTQIEVLHYRDHEKKPSFKLKAWGDKYPSMALTIDELIEKLATHVCEIKK